MSTKGMIFKPLPKRFADKIDRSDPEGCWLWTGALDNNGYGQIQATRNGKKQPVKAHRIAWELLHEVELPPDLCVMHMCDVRSCVNPDHLQVGSVGANNTDMALKGRHANSLLDTCSNGHPFDDVVMSRGRPTRICRQCRREANRRYRSRRKETR